MKIHDIIYIDYEYNFKPFLVKYEEYLFCKKAFNLKILYSYLFMQLDGGTLVVE